MAPMDANASPLGIAKEIAPECDWVGVGELVGEAPAFGEVAAGVNGVTIDPRSDMSRRKANLQEGGALGVAVIETVVVPVPTCAYCGES